MESPQTVSPLTVQIHASPLLVEGKPAPIVIRLLNSSATEVQVHALEFLKMDGKAAVDSSTWAFPTTLAGGGDTCADHPCFVTPLAAGRLPCDLKFTVTIGDKRWIGTFNDLDEDGRMWRVLPALKVLDEPDSIYSELDIARQNLLSLESTVAGQLQTLAAYDPDPRVILPLWSKAPPAGKTLYAVQKNTPPPGGALVTKPRQGPGEKITFTMGGGSDMAPPQPPAQPVAGPPVRERTGTVPISLPPLPVTKPNQTVSPNPPPRPQAAPVPGGWQNAPPSLSEKVGALGGAFGVQPEIVYLDEGGLGPPSSEVKPWRQGSRALRIIGSLAIIAMVVLGAVAVYMNFFDEPPPKPSNERLTDTNVPVSKPEELSASSAGDAPDSAQAAPPFISALLDSYHAAIDKGDLEDARGIFNQLTPSLDQSSNVFLREKGKLQSLETEIHDFPETLKKVDAAAYSVLTKASFDAAQLETVKNAFALLTDKHKRAKESQKSAIDQAYRNLAKSVLDVFNQIVEKAPDQAELLLKCLPEAPGKGQAGAGAPVFTQLPMLIARVEQTKQQIEAKKVAMAQQTSTTASVTPAALTDTLRPFSISLAKGFRPSSITPTPEEPSTIHESSTPTVRAMSPSPSPPPEPLAPLQDRMERFIRKFLAAGDSGKGKPTDQLLFLGGGLHHYFDSGITADTEAQEKIARISKDLTEHAERNPVRRYTFNRIVSSTVIGENRWRVSYRFNVDSRDRDGVQSGGERMDEVILFANNDTFLLESIDRISK